MTATGIPTLTAGRSRGLAYLGGSGALVVPVSFTMSAAYSAGGDPLTLPTADTRGRELDAVVLLTPHDGTRTYAWDGSKTAPKIKAFSAFATEVAGAVDLSANTLKALLIFKN